VIRAKREAIRARKSVKGYWIRVTHLLKCEKR